MRGKRRCVLFSLFVVTAAIGRGSSFGGRIHDLHPLKNREGEEWPSEMLILINPMAETLWAHGCLS